MFNKNKFKKIKVCKLLQVSRSNQYKNKLHRPKRYKMKDDKIVLNNILNAVKERATYGVPRVTAIVNRSRRKEGQSRWNIKRIERVMKINKLILPQSGTRKEREHKGVIITLKSNLRYCSDIFEIKCWDGGKVRVAFSLDCHDREAMSFVSESRPLNHHDIIKLMDKTVLHRFGEVEKLPGSIQWLSDQGPQYICEDTKYYATSWGFAPITTPAYSPESNGMAEAFVKLFKRDYVYVNELWTVESVLRQIPLWFEDYNKNHPHSGLHYKSPLEYRLDNELSN